MFRRALRDRLLKSKKSVLLLGPRQVGKSTLMRSLEPDLTLNLAHEPTYLELARRPTELEERIAATAPRVVLIDEIQRLPSLLNTIQVLIDERGQRFLLTGSSARKLRTGGANLLPGRVHTYSLGPMTVGELGDAAPKLEVMLATGTLPGILAEADADEREKTLRSYAATYLREEIRAEALTRNIEGFARFLDLAAAAAGGFLDLTKLAGDAMVPRQTATRFFDILIDTLVVFRVDAFAKSDRRRLVQHPRYFFFDCGILNGIFGSFEVAARRSALFEHFMAGQLVHTAAALDIDMRLSSYRTSAGAEVDFIVETKKTKLALELKASTNVGPNDLRGLASFGELAGGQHRPVVAYLGNARRELNGVSILPWRDALDLIA